MSALPDDWKKVPELKASMKNMEKVVEDTASSAEDKSHVEDCVDVLHECGNHAAAQRVSDKYLDKE